VIDLAVRVHGLAWRRLSAGCRAHGERFYDWTLLETREQTPGEHALQIHRHRATGEIGHLPGLVTHPVTMAEICGRRRVLERRGGLPDRQLTALSEHQVRLWTSWQRWTLLAMLARAFLTVITAQQARAVTDQPTGFLLALIPR
jgi:hypothetical protein